MKIHFLSLLVASIVAGCSSSGVRGVIPLGTARASADFADYDIRRVGVLPPEGLVFEAGLVEPLRDALTAAFTAETSFELVPLGLIEMESIERVDPARTGSIHPTAVLELARRAGLDALLAARVVDLRPYEPVRLGLDVDLIAVETGLVIWSGHVRVDTGDSRALAAIESWQAAMRSGGESEHAVDLLSPRRLVEFAAAQVAMLL